MSRLDNLLILLKDGGSIEIREKAAFKIGEIAQIFPLECLSLMEKISVLLLDNEWDTRVAAAKAVGYIVRSLNTDLIQACAAIARHEENDSLYLNFERLDIPRIFSTAAPLLRCSAQNFNLSLFNSEKDLKKRYALQRRLLMARIGCEATMGNETLDNVITQIEQNYNDLVKEEDVIDVQEDLSTQKRKSTSEIASIVKNYKRKMNDKNHSSTLNTSIFNFQVLQVSGDSVDVIASFILDLVNGMFHNQWEYRHGCLTSLREVFSIYSKKLNIYSREETKVTTMSWLEEVAGYCLITLALDKYVDFSKDEMVSPVQQLAAQVLGYISSISSFQLNNCFLRNLTALFGADWNAQYGALLASKYISLLSGNISIILAPEIVACLSLEYNEFIHSLSANILTTIYDLNSIDFTLYCTIEKSLWNILESYQEKDTEFSSTIVQVLRALRHCLVAEREENFKRGRKEHLILIFMLHVNKEVREESIALLLCLGTSSSSKNIKKQLFIDILTNLFELILNEQVNSILDRTVMVWDAIISHFFICFPSSSLPCDIFTMIHWISSISSLNRFITSQCELSTIYYTASAIASLVAYTPMHDILWKYLLKVLFECLNSPLASSQYAALCFLKHYLTKDKNEVKKKKLIDYSLSSLWNILLGTPIHERSALRYSEQITNINIIKKLISSVQKEVSILQGDINFNIDGTSASYSRAVAEHLARYPGESSNKKYLQLRQRIFRQDETIQQDYLLYRARVLSACSIAMLEIFPTSESLPSKLNSLIAGLLHSLRVETCRIEQKHAARAFVRLVILCKNRVKCQAKLVENICRDLSSEETNRKEGAKLTVEEFGNVPHLFKEMPSAFKQLTQGLPQSYSDFHIMNEELIERSLNVWKILFPKLQKEMASSLVYLLPHLYQLIIQDKFINLQQLAIECLSKACHQLGTIGINAILQPLESSMLDARQESIRYGSLLLIEAIVTEFGSSILPFLSHFLPYSLRSFGDSSSKVRRVASELLSTLVPLVPIEINESLDNEDPSKRFLSKLLLGKSIEPIDLSGVHNNVILRDYQVLGVSWIHFLADNNLHGILGDDMGLGKTLQILTVIAYYRKMHPDLLLPSLIVCPTSIVGHWREEIRKHFCPEYLKVFAYTGQRNIPEGCLVIATYAQIRQNIESLQQIRWYFCVLDEGHVIKNPTSKIAQSIYKLNAARRFVLTGTPIQNAVSDLWSLFEFLMPGYLGERAAFTKQFSRPIETSRLKKANAAQRAAGAESLLDLNQRVSPFVLRRTKTEVLKDLPSRVIQDVACELTSSQRELYCSLSDQKQVFESLHFLLKVCVHPSLVLHSVNLSSSSQLSISTDITNSGKFQALLELLESCSIGQNQEEKRLSTHRCLIFAKHQRVLDLIENLFQQHLPSITYLRLDGTVAPDKRYPIATQFNDDLSIDALLLTTAIGGLGLSLIGADVVIFMEHDWNPFKDLQAMDRAYRIGQTRAVNVYRLISKDTLEEDIMNLQQFKQTIAKTVVKEDETNVEVHTKDILKLLKDSASTIQSLQTTTKSLEQNDLPASIGKVLNLLDDLWDDKQYEDLDLPT